MKNRPFEKLISEKQREQFTRYAALIQEWAESINITAEKSADRITVRHFEDSLAILPYINAEKITGIVDVGTGAGFPGIPLAIMFPDIPVILIEVTRKKVDFLNLVIRELNLTNITIDSRDWRTFLRKSTYNANLFVARASLDPDELSRMFSPISPYRAAQLVYWASRDWTPSAKTAPLVTKSIEYVCGHRVRQLIFMVYSAA